MTPDDGPSLAARATHHIKVRRGVGGDAVLERRAVGPLPRGGVGWDGGRGVGARGRMKQRCVSASVLNISAGLRGVAPPLECSARPCPHRAPPAGGRARDGTSVSSGRRRDGQRRQSDFGSRVRVGAPTFRTRGREGSAERVFRYAGAGAPPAVLAGAHPGHLHHHPRLPAHHRVVDERVRGRGPSAVSHADLRLPLIA